MQDAKITLGKVARRFAALCVPLLLITAAVLFVMYQTQASAIKELTDLRELQTTTLAAREVGQGLSSVRGDLRYLSQQPSLHEFLRDQGATQWERLAKHYYALAVTKGHYDQVRLVDEGGRNLMRVDQQEGNLRIVSADELKQRAPTRYADVIRQLKKDELFISPFELNVEQGVLEQPIKPIIRFITAVYEPEGQKRGAIMLNYLGDRLIARLRTGRQPASGHTWLVNEHGHWLVGPRPEDEWGFMYPDKNVQRFADSHPAAWAKMSRVAGKGQFTSEAGLITYLAMAPSDLIQGNFVEAAPETKGHWYFISYVPASILSVPLQRLRMQLIVAGMLLAIVLAAAAWAVAYVNQRRAFAERAVAAERERYQQLVNNLNVGVYRVQPNDDGDFVEANTALLRMLRVNSKQDLQRHSVKEFYANADDFTKLSRQLNENSAVVDDVVEGRRSNGERFWASLTAVKKTEQDGSVYFDGIMSDVTARRAAENALKESEFKFRSLLESGPDAILIVDEHGRITLANAQAERLFGYVREELVGKQIETLLPPELKSVHVKHRARYMGSAEARPMGAVLDLYAIHKTGKRIPIDVSLSPIQLREGAATIASVRDVSQRKQAELEIRLLNSRLAEHITDLTAVNHELEAFSYSVSHDLRAPLRSIDGFSQALIEDYGERLDELGKDYLTRVRSASQHMALLIDDLLKLSRITRSELTKETVDMTPMARDILDGLQQVEPRRVVRYHVEDELTVQGDARLLRIALTNLLSNAWKFTSECEEAVIRVGRLPQGNGNAYFVTDNGAGFNIAYANKLFGVFQRLHSVDQFPGTGVGLAIVQRVIHRHGGKIWAEAEVGKGASFFFTLSQKESEHECQNHIAGRR